MIATWSVGRDLAEVVGRPVLVVAEDGADGGRVRRERLDLRVEIEAAGAPMIARVSGQEVEESVSPSADRLEVVVDAVEAERHDRAAPVQRRAPGRRVVEVQWCRRPSGRARPTPGPGQFFAPPLQEFAGVGVSAVGSVPSTRTGPSGRTRP